MAQTLCFLHINSGLLSFENAVENAWPVCTLSSQLPLELVFAPHSQAIDRDHFKVFGHTDISTGDTSHLLSPC